MKIALVHDHLIQIGGAEQVLKVLQEIYPESPTYTLFYDQKKLGDFFSGREIRTSFIQKLPLALPKYKWYLSLMPKATESYDLSGYDVILSSASAMAKGIKKPPSAVHICYCHTPTRYLWTDREEYLQNLRYPDFFKKIIANYLDKLAVWDKQAAQKVDYFIANSENVRQRIKKYYQRDSTVIHPPVETEKFYVSDKINGYYLTGGRLVAYKRYDLVVQCFNKIGAKLKIFGTGPEMSSLRKIAKKNIEFLGWVSKEQQRELYSKCLAFLHPQEEDFGITAVEAMASGRPVIAYAKGGALETVAAGKTGEFIEEQNWEALAYAIAKFDPARYDAGEIKRQAERFGEEVFKRKVAEFMEECVKERVR